MFAKSTSFLFVLLSQIAFAQVTIERPDIIETQKSYRNYIKNPTALKNLNGTSTSSAALTRDTDTADKLDGVASFNCDTSASGGYCLWQTNTIQEGDKSGNCEASIAYKGDASLYSLRVTDGTNTLIEVALGNKTDWTNEWVNYPCGSTRDVRLVQTTAGTSAAVNIGRIYYGQATNIGLTSGISDWKDFPSVAAGTLITATTTNPTYGTVDENIAQYRYVGDSAEIRWSFKSSVAGTAGSGNYLFNIPSSICVIDTAKTGTNGSARNQKSIVGHFKMAYGTTTVATGSAHVYNSSQIYFESAYVNSSAGASAGPWGSSFLSFTAAESISALITVPCQGRSSNVSAAKADQTNYGWTSYTPTFTGFGTVTISSANDCKHKRDGEDLLIDCKFTTGTHTATEARMSLPGSLTSAAFPSIKSAGGHVVARSETTAASVLPLIEPSVTYLTFGNLSGSTASLTKVNGNALASSNTYSLFARVPISGWTENQKAPVLVGSVTSAATSALRVEFVSFGGSTVLNSACTTTPCTIWNQSGGISSVTRTSAGQYVVNFASGTWSVVPTCVYTGFLTDHKVNTSATLTAVGVSSRDSSFTFADGQTNQVICFGPR
jgi:hypothetical protein